MERVGCNVARVGLVSGEGGAGLGSDEEEVADGGWVTHDTPPQEHEFTANTGITVPIPTTPLGFIQLFITRELLNFIMEETNSYALYCCDVLKQPSALDWQGCTVTDIAHYLGLSMLMGINWLPSMNLYWSTNSMFGNPMFTQTMTF